MKKRIAILSLIVVLCLLVGCAGTPVVYHINCDCSGTSSTTPTPNLPTPEGALKTGLVIVSDISDSKEGEAKYDITVVAVLVDDSGVIQGCIIDGVSTSVKFDTAGVITTDLAVAPKTKNELGSDYGMVAWGGAIAEWDAQAQALADFAVGKTVAELKEGAIDETGKAPAGSDLATSATIYLAGYVAAIEKAVANATHLGAMGGDTLKLATINGIDGSKSAAADKAGTAQLEVTSTAITLKDGKITSCAIDSVQAKVNFDAAGKITSDLTAAIKTKNELGSDYGMVAWGGAIAEWDAQAKSFAEYVTGKTPDEVKNIAVDETTKPTDTDLNTSVTIAIGGFQALIEKAAK